MPYINLTMPKSATDTGAVHHPFEQSPDKIRTPRSQSLRPGLDTGFVSDRFGILADKSESQTLHRVFSRYRIDP